MFPHVVDLVATDRDSDAVGVDFLGAIFAHDSGISCFFVAGLVRWSMKWVCWCQ